MSDKNIYSNEEMRELSIEEANCQLDPTQFERWNRLHTEKILGQAQQNKEKIEEENKNALDTLRDSAKDELTETIEVFGTEIKVNISLNEKQKELFKKVNEAELSGDDINHLDETEEMIYELLGEMTINYSKKDWEDKFAGDGSASLGLILKEITEKYQTIIKKKMKR